MDKLMFENEILKIKIKQYQEEYLNKKGIFEPDAKMIILMRKAVSARLGKEIKELTRMHNEIANKINEQPLHWQGFTSW